MKKIMALVTALLMMSAVSAFAQDETIEVKVNGETIEFDQQPVVDGDNLLLPFRFIAEKLGANVTWYEDNADNITIQQVLSQLDDSVTIMQIGNPNIFINGNVLALEKAPLIVGERTLVTAAAIEGITGATVEWDKDASTVTVTK